MMLRTIKMLKIDTLLFSLMLMLLVSCSDGSDQSPEQPKIATLFDSTSVPPILPFPNAAYSAANGRLAFPLAPGATPGDLGDVTVALNTLDGFSTSAPLWVDFAEAIDVASIWPGDNVRVFEVTVDNLNVPTTIVAELMPSVDYSAAVSAVMDSRLLIKPLRPLNGSSAYLVGVSDSLMAVAGLPMGPSSDYLALRRGKTASASTAVNSELLTQLISAQEALLADSGMPVERIVVSFSFQTQTTTALLEAINTAATPTSIALIRPTMTINGETQPLTTLPFAALSAVFGLTPTGQSDVYTGTFDLPYYLNIPSGPEDDSVRDSFMRNSVGEPVLDPATLPVSMLLTVPILVAIPNNSIDASLIKPASGWPVAIYHHGISGNRTNMLLIADALTSRGVAMVAIDQVVHGVVPNDANALPGNVFAAVGVDFYDAQNERHFNLDLNSDGEIDPAGANFSSPRNQLTGRDNLRQSVSDLIYLVRTLPTVTLPGMTGNAFDADNIHFVSLSLGSIVGSMLAGVNTDVGAFSLSAPGGGGAKSGEGAPNGNAGALAGLSALGLEQGTQAFEDHLTLLTTIGGSGDPLNYGAAASAKHPIHVTEIIGSGTSEDPPDQTIPNDVLNLGQYAGLVVETAPLAGTEPLIRSMNLNALLGDAMNLDGLRVVARFLRGDHQSQVSPTTLLSAFAVPEVTQEIHRQTATFIASGGTAIEVVDGTLLEMNFSAPTP
jgi:hypothetical protein